MIKNQGERTEAVTDRDFALRDLRRCLEMLEGAGPLRIPSNMNHEGERKLIRNECEWILTQPEYLDWLVSERSQVIRFVGSHCSRKTAIAAFLAQDINRKLQTSGNSLLACFFCDSQSQGGETPTAILRSLVCQLLLQRSRLYQYIRSDFENSSEGQHFENHLHNFHGLWRNFQDMLQDEQAGSVFVILDGIDETSGSTLASVLHAMRDFLYRLPAYNARLKLLVTCTNDIVNADDEMGDNEIVLDMDRKRVATARDRGSNAAAPETPIIATDTDPSSQIADIMTDGRYLGIIELLLNKGADVLSRDKRSGRTALSWAAEKGHESAVELLLDRGADIESRDNHGQTPLLWAAGSGHKRVAKLLLRLGAYVDTRDRNDNTPLSNAARNGHVAAVKLLLKSGADACSQNGNGQTPLACAAENGHLSIVHELLGAGAEADLPDTYHRTPLSRAAEKGHSRVCNLLREKCVEIDSRDVHHRTPLFWAARSGQVEVVSDLLNYGAITSSQDTKYGQTPLHVACINGYHTMARHLLDRGAFVDARDKIGRTPLSWVAGNGEQATVKLLLDNGADVNSIDQTGRTPISWAAGSGEMATVRQLLDRNAEFSLADRHGRTPISWASENAYGAVVRMLREKST